MESHKKFRFLDETMGSLLHWLANSKDTLASSKETLADGKDTLAGPVSAVFSILFVVALGDACSAPVQASEHPLPSISVSYADLDLGKPAHVAVLKRRVRHAAETVCLTPGIATVSIHARSSRCVIAARSSAAPQIIRAIAARAGVERPAA